MADIKERLKSIPKQDRMFIQGSIEYIQDQWIFFDEQGEGAVLQEMICGNFDIKINGKWTTFMEIDDGIAYGDHTYTLKKGDSLKILKPLIYVYKEWLCELTDESLYQFVTILNKLNFSVFDCIHCHNFLFFQSSKHSNTGVNFLIFDNEEQVCAVHHHFKRLNNHVDRYEITINDGKRYVLFSSI